MTWVPVRLFFGFYFVVVVVIIIPLFPFLFGGV